MDNSSYKEIWYSDYSIGKLHLLLYLKVQRADQLVGS